MKKKKLFKKFLVLGAIVCGVFVCGATSVFFAKYNSDFFSNIFLSLTITSSVVPDDDEPEDVGGGGGNVIYKVPVEQGEVKVIDVPDVEDSEIPADTAPDQIVSEFMDEVNGISVSKQSNVGGITAESPVDLLVTVPFLPAMSINDVLIPESPSEDSDITHSSSRMSFSGVATPYSYILLEISSRPNIVTLFTGSDGKWSYDLPYSLGEGLHHAYVWRFSQTDGVKTLISSSVFIVSATSEDINSGVEKRTNLFMRDGSLKAAVSNSYLVSSLKEEKTGGQMLYVNGRILNDREALTVGEKLSFIVFVKPLFGEFKDVDSVALKFSYKIYDENGGLIEEVSDGDDSGYVRHLKNGVLSFTQHFSFTSPELLGIGNRSLVIQVDANGFSYWLPLDFEVIKEGAVGVFDKYEVILLLSLALIILVVGSLYTGQFIPRSPHRRGK